MLPQRFAQAWRAAGGSRNSGARLLLFGLLIVGVTTPASAALDELTVATRRAIAAAATHDPILAELLPLAEAGAHQLALAQLSTRIAATPPHQRPLPWQLFQIDLLGRDQQWLALIEQLSQRHDPRPTWFEQWAREQRLLAHIQLQQPIAARRQLAELIWLAPSLTPDSRDPVPPALAEPLQRSVALPRWRRLVMRSYLQQQRYDDAHAALLRYQQDYGRDPADRLLQLEVLLGHGDATGVRQQLIGTLDSALPQSSAAITAEIEQVIAAEGREAIPLLLLAQLRSGTDAALLQVAIEQQLRDYPATDPHRPPLLAVALQVALAIDDDSAIIDRLEQLLATAHLPQLPGIELANVADLLWRHYLRYARTLGNRHHLLLGDDRAWFAQWQRLARRQPLSARSLLALLARQGAQQVSQQRAHRLLSQQLHALPGGEQLLQRLYLQSEQFPTAAQLPVSVRLLLADDAIATANVTLASTLLQGLSPPTDVADRFMWELRRTKVFLLAGDVDAAATALQQLLAVAPPLTPNQHDRLLQLLFDLQAAEAHPQALPLLQQLYQRGGTLQQRRELLYWIADSQLAIEQPQAAAASYLQSALLEQPNATDPWSQTARYQAAKALIAAGLRRDAATLLQQLLAATDDPQRQTLLRRELEQLRLPPQPSRLAAS